MESDRVVTARKEGGEGEGRKGSEYDVRRTCRIELRLQFQNAGEQVEKPLYPCSRVNCRPPPLSPVYSSTFIRFLASSPTLLQYPCHSPFLDFSPFRFYLFLSLPLSLSHLVVSHGTGIRIVISNRATTHEPLPCRSKFVNGLRIPGLPRGSH